MKPHLEEAWRALRLADRDIQAFHVLKERPEVHISLVCFHAQQAVEKSLKAILFSRRIEFERIHDLVKLARLLSECDLVLPVREDQLRRLNPFAVTFRYDDLDVEPISRLDAASMVAAVRRGAEEQVSAAAESEGADGWQAV
jgi:HEPN domain-containing protein